MQYPDRKNQNSWSARPFVCDFILECDNPVKEHIVLILTVSKMKKDVNADRKICEIFEKSKQDSDM